MRSEHSVASPAGASKDASAEAPGPGGRIAAAEGGLRQGGFGGFITQVDPTRESEWDKLVARHPASTVFHGAAWADVLKRSYGHTPCYLVAPAAAHSPGANERWPLAGDRVSILPLMEINSVVTGRRGVSLPFTDFCAPVVAEAAETAKLFEAARELGRRRKWRYLELRGPDPVPLNSTPSITYAGHRLSLEGNGEEVAGRFEPEVRRAIRKAVREGVQCEVARSYEAVKIFYELHEGTRRRHGLPPQPLQFFANIQAWMLSKELGFVALARWKGIPVAGAVFFCQGKKATFKYGASNHAFQRLRGSDLVMAEAISWLCGHGFEELDFGRSAMGNEGLRRFKRGFGANEGRIDYVRYDFKKEQFCFDRDRTEGWFNGIFRHTPRAVARLAGALLYPHLS